MSITLRPYRPEDAPAWNGFVAAARNGPFLFDRGYMDYHSSRFTDASLLLQKHGKLIGLLPANAAGEVLASHGGLTYGGLVLAPEAGLEEVEQMLASCRDWASGKGFKRLIYKTIPAIYHRAPAEEDRWALARLGARLTRRDALAVVGVSPPPQRRARANDLKKAVRRGGVEIGLSQDYAGFWPVLEARLGESHDARPVHSLGEIRLLARRFPQNIRLVTARIDGIIESGAVHFVTPSVVHCQYSAGSALARETRALDLVYAEGIAFAAARGLPFDFGTSAEPGGGLNAGLQKFKESYGARTVAHDYYELDC